MRSSRALCTFLVLTVAVFLGSGVAHAQATKGTATVASYTDAYCSGFVAESPIAELGQVVGIQGGRSKNEVSVGEFVYLAGEGMRGVNLNQEFFIVRPGERIKNIGTIYDDVAHVKIVDVRDTVLVAEITFSCNPLGVGDAVLAPEGRLQPVTPPAAPVDRFAAPRGQGQGQIIASKSHLIQLGQNLIVYLNVGAEQGIQPGNTLRVFRYASEGSVNVFSRDIYRKYSKAYQYPREVLGECVVLKTGKNTATALVTQSVEELAIGDHVELK
ncbi:MAG: hypothetical protein PHX83_12245 [Acidobacteriia bacterium]|nr:hypothetical protein [Terriglobia bacterium]